MPNRRIRFDKCDTRVVGGPKGTIDQAANKLGRFSGYEIIDLNTGLRAVLLSKIDQVSAVMRKGRSETFCSYELGDVITSEHDFAGGIEISDDGGRFEVCDGGRSGLLFFGIVVIE